MPPAPLSLETLGHAVGYETLDVHRRGHDVRAGWMPKILFNEAPAMYSNLVSIIEFVAGASSEKTTQKGG